MDIVIDVHKNFDIWWSFGESWLLLCLNTIITSWPLMKAQQAWVSFQICVTEVPNNCIISYPVLAFQSFKSYFPPSVFPEYSIHCIYIVVFTIFYCHHGQALLIWKCNLMFMGLNILPKHQWDQVLGYEVPHFQNINLMKFFEEFASNSYHLYKVAVRLSNKKVQGRKCVEKHFRSFIRH